MNTMQGAARPSLGSPVWRIAAATGEEPDVVLAGLRSLGLLGYEPDEVWTLVEAALNSGTTIGELAEMLARDTPLYPLWAAAVVLVKGESGEGAR